MFIFYFLCLGLGVCFRFWVGRFGGFFRCVGFRLGRFLIGFFLLLVFLVVFWRLARVLKRGFLG